LVLGISFGVLARSLGWGVVAPIVFSVITFSESARFAVAAVLGAGGGALAAIVAAVLLNARFSGLHHSSNWARRTPVARLP
jgi:predicted branched-subunit amino acid permease